VEELTILEIARLVLALSASDSEIRFIDLPTDDPRQRKPDVNRAWNELGWQPRTPVRAGLAATIDWYRAGRRRPS
jgi:nucleoside-diphosphate-sugar epimerase